MSADWEEHSIALGRLAVQRGLLREEDFKATLRRTAPGSGEGARPPIRLTDVLLERKLLTPGQVRDLEAALAAIAEEDATRLAGPMELPQNPPVSASSEPSTRGTKRRSFGKYMLVCELGRGGMSVVWEGYDTDLRRRVAIKFLTGVSGRYIDAAQEEIIRRFYREAHSAAKLTHPNIVKIFDVGELDGQHYIAMEYIDGETLHLLASRRALDLKGRVRALRDAAQALDHAHRAGVLHRDIKPQNIMVDKDGHTFIMDFGLARDLKEDERLTLSGISIGTPSYMPPEHAQGSKNVIDARSDVYSLGAVLYEMLAGRPPFIGNSPMAVMMAVVNKEPETPRRYRPQTPPDLEAVCLKAMDKDKERRYATAGELAEDLDRWLRAEPVAARRRSALHRMMRRARRQAVPIAVMMAAGLVGAGWWLTARQERRDHQRLLEEHLTRAASAAGKGAWDEEIELLDVALKVDPDSREVRRRIAEAQERLAQRRREEERRAKVKEALEIVRRRFSLHQFDDETLAAVERALELDPENSDARHYRGRIRLAHREFEPALEDLRAALAVQPKLACALADSGEVFRLQGKWDEARGFFEQALALDGKLVEAHHGMGHVLDAEGDLEGAEKAYTTALELQKSHSYYADRAEVRARLFCRGGHGDAKLLAEAFSDSETSLGLEKSAAGYHARGKCSLERKDYAKAIADFEEALRLAPQDDRARADLEFARKKAAEPQ